MTAPDRGAVGELIGRLAELRRIGSSGDLEIQLLEREQRALDEAADALARLSARVEELEAALREIDGQAEARIVAWLREQAAAGRALAKRPISGNAAIAYDSAAARLMRAATQITRGEHREAGDRG